ncbi:MAG TPA: DinB family protein [Saprospiraceae bacterium]|nr:DinB family protein [Saprospiraceae bacterium]
MKLRLYASGFLLFSLHCAFCQIQPLLDGAFQRFSGTSSIIMYTAEKMPESLYNYTPASDVRTFGQQIQHIIESNYFFCNQILEEGKTIDTEAMAGSKSKLLNALSESIRYCEMAHSQLGEKSSLEKLPFQGQLKPKLEILNTNIMHNIMHYGNLVIYLRMNGFVPPTSDQEFMKKLMGE